MRIKKPIPNPTSDAGRRAFTLVELLVVIGIIALLIAILLPALNRARDASQTVVCMSNLREIGNGLRMYANDNRDKYPDKFTTGNFNYRRLPGMNNPADPSSYPEWMGLPAVLHGIKVTDYDLNMSQAQVRSGLQVALGRKGQYVSARSGVWTCPSFPPAFLENGNTYAWSIAAVLGKWTSLNRGRKINVSDSTLASNWVAWDNFDRYPYTPGAMAGTSVNGYTISGGQTKWITPHRGRSGPRRASNFLLMDGRVVTLVYESTGWEVQQ